MSWKTSALPLPNLWYIELEGDYNLWQVMLYSHGIHKAVHSFFCNIVTSVPQCINQFLKLIAHRDIFMSPLFVLFCFVQSQKFCYFWYV